MEVRVIDPDVLAPLTPMKLLQCCHYQVTDFTG